MSITKTEYCMHGQHFVESEKITWMYPTTGGRRRICSDCKAKIKKMNRELKNATKKLAKAAA